MDDLRDAPAPALRLGPMEASLGFLLRLGQLVSFRDWFADLGALGLRPGEATVLMLVAANPGVRQGVLARALMIKRAHMTKMVRAMEEDGLVRRTVPEDDRRAQELWLTEAGRARLAAFDGPFRAHEAAAERALTTAEAAELKRLLRKYVGLEGRT
jgi:DNA-binding MarR family transcriptional regulator